MDHGDVVAACSGLQWDGRSLHLVLCNPVEVEMAEGELAGALRPYEPHMRLRVECDWG